MIPAAVWMGRHPWRVWLIAGTVLLVTSSLALMWVASTLPPREMRARVHTSLDFDTPPASVGADPALDPTALAVRAGLDPGDPFAVQWDGYLVVDVPGRYRLRLRSDDGVAAWVDDQLVTDHLSGAGEQYVIEPVDLGRGLHRIRIRYVQLGGETLFRLAWATPEWREQYDPVFAVAEADPAPSSRAVMLAVGLPRRIALVWSLWLVAGLTLGLIHITSRVAGPALWAALRWRDVAPFVLAAIAMVSFSITDGTLPWRGWAPDEVDPKVLFNAAEMRLMDGWFHLYPAFHIGLLVAVTSPIFALVEWGWMSFEDPSLSIMLQVVARIVSAVMGVLTLVAVAMLAHLGLGRARTLAGRGEMRHWLLAPYVLLGAPVFVFYARTGNVDIPYVFWCALAILAFIRALAGRGERRHGLRDTENAPSLIETRRESGAFPLSPCLRGATRLRASQPGGFCHGLREERTLSAHVWLGVLVAAAATAKDQAYGFFPGVALVLLWSAWRHTPADLPAAQRIRLTVTDRGLLAGLLAFVLAYVVLLGVLINPSGVADHFRLVTGGAQPFRMFPATIDGFLDLTATTLRLAWLTIGPLASAAAVAGLAIAAAHPARYRNVLPLLALPVSYLITLIGVVGYVYDRFLLGVVIVAAVFAAVGFDWLLGLVRSARARTALAIIAAVLLVYPGLSLSVRMATDTRTEVEHWLDAHTADDPLVLGVGDRKYLPNLYPYRNQVEGQGSIEAILAWKADLIVVNENWLERREEDAGEWLRRGLAPAGYEEVFSADGWPIDPGLRVLVNGTLAIDPVLSNIRKVSPPLSVWRKVDGSRR